MKSFPGTTTRIQVVYPKPEQHIYDDSTFLMGGIRGVEKQGLLFINHTPVPVSPSGFFAWKIPIKSGMNPIKLEVRATESSQTVAEELFALYGVPPLSVLPLKPLSVHSETILPAQDVWLTLDDKLTVAVSASEGAIVSMTIPGLLDVPVSVPPLQAPGPFLDTREAVFAQLHWTRQRIAVKGYYQASVSISQLLNAAHAPGKALTDLPIVLHVRYGDAAIQYTCPGRVSILSHPKSAVIHADRAVTRTAPENGARLTPQRLGTHLAVDGLDRGWLRARLTRDDMFYVAQSDVTFQDTHQNVNIATPAALALIKTTRLSLFSSQVNLVLAQQPASACPVQIETLPSEQTNRLHVRLYNVCSHCDFMQYPPDDAVIRQIHWRSVAENAIELWIDLHRPLAGYDYALRDGEWQITVKTLPTAISDIRILIDPGHGGSESGSVGLNGLPEKELNLTVSRLLRDALHAEGFIVAMTRNADEAVSLEARGQAAVETQADIVMSIHHNALPDGRDPLQERGVSTFYYHAFSKPLADALLTGLTVVEPSVQSLPSYGVFYDSLYMTRIHQATAVLVELGFFTHPEDFEQLIQPEFQQTEARRLAQALRRYCLPPA
jgi:N-acetylmuramoyl-L-alanine amidase